MMMVLDLQKMVLELQMMMVLDFPIVRQGDLQILERQKIYRHHYIR